MGKEGATDLPEDLAAAFAADPLLEEAFWSRGEIYQRGVLNILDTGGGGAAREQRLHVVKLMLAEEAHRKKARNGGNH